MPSHVAVKRGSIVIFAVGGAVRFCSGMGVVFRYMLSCCVALFVAEFNSP